MDKRTLLFVFLLTIALFLVNLFFEGRNRESLQEWQRHQAAHKQKTSEQMEKEMVTRSVKKSALPVVFVTSDKEGKQPAGVAVATPSGLWKVKTDIEPVKTLYSKGESYTLVPASIQLGGVTLYAKDGNKPFLIDELPEFGKFTLQIVLFKPEGFDVLLGDLTDGQFAIPEDTAARLKEEIAGEAASNPPKRPNGLILWQNGQKFSPVAFFNGETNSLVWLGDLYNANAVFQEKPAQRLSEANEKGEEKYFVLENGYQQLVFSNVGGALAEINLPFQTKSDKESVVREIEFDRDMVKQHPENAHFPAHSFYSAPHAEGKEAEFHATGKLGGYYPLIRRDVIEKSSQASYRMPAKFFAANIVSQYPEMANTVFKVTHFDATSITFESIQATRRITKTYTIVNESKGAPYCVDLVINIEGDGRGLWLTSGVPEVEWISGSPAPALKFRMTRNGKPEVNSIDLPKESIVVTSVYPDWICNSNGFLGTIIDPITATEPGYSVQYVPGNEAPSRLVEIDSDYKRFKAVDLPGYVTMLPLKAGRSHFRLFAGPFSDGVLKEVDQFFVDQDGSNPDYKACQTFHGWFSFISEPFAKFLLVLMKLFYAVTGSWAFSIVLLTIALRVMLYPLNAWSTKSMVKMQKIAPEVTAIQEKYKKDPKKAQLAIMALYKERGVNPVSGCLPLLIQMPFLIGMFDLLKSTFELRGASFIPGWIDNLTAPDVLFSWNTPIFLIGNQFHLLPFLLGGVMFLQQRLMSPLPKDKSTWTEQQRQQRMMGSVMTVVFTVMFYNFPSGLNIYWLSSMLLGILQQWWTTRQMQKAK